MGHHVNLIKLTRVLKNLSFGCFFVFLSLSVGCLHFGNGRPLFWVYPELLNKSYWNPVCYKKPPDCLINYIFLTSNLDSYELCVVKVNNNKTCLINYIFLTSNLDSYELCVVKVKNNKTSLINYIFLTSKLDSYELCVVKIKNNKTCLINYIFLTSKLDSYEL